MVPPVDISGGEVPLRANILIANRAEFIKFMARKGIQVVNECQSVHEVPFVGVGDQTAFPNAFRYGNEQVTLPCGPDQDFKNVEEVIRVIDEIPPDMFAEYSD